MFQKILLKITNNNLNCYANKHALSRLLINEQICFSFSCLLGRDINVANVRPSLCVGRIDRCRSKMDWYTKEGVVMSNKLSIQIQSYAWSHSIDVHNANWQSSSKDIQNYKTFTGLPTFANYVTRTLYFSSRICIHPRYSDICMALRCFSLGVNFFNI